MRIALIVRGGVEEGSEDCNPAPVFVQLIRRLAGATELEVFSLHGKTRATMTSFYRGTAAAYRFAGADVYQLGRIKTPRLRLLAEVVRTTSAIRARRSRRGPPDLLHGIGLSPGVVAAFAGRLLGVPSVVSLIGGELSSLPEIDYGELRTAKGRAVVRRLLRHAGTITVASRFMQDRVERHGARARLVPFGIDASRFQHPVARPDGPPLRLLHVGTLCALKDQLTLVAAVRLLVDEGLDVMLDVVGFDDWQGCVQREADRLDLTQRVAFHGWRSPDEIVSLSRRAHAFVMTSVDDVAPVAVLEAAASGLPIVGTNVGFIADWAPDMAIAVPIQNPGALADALRGLFANRDARERMAARAQEWVCRHAGLDANDAYVDLYAELIAAVPGR